MGERQGAAGRAGVEVSSASCGAWPWPGPRPQAQVAVPRLLDARPESSRRPRWLQAASVHPPLLSRVLPGAGAGLEMTGTPRRTGFSSIFLAFVHGIIRASTASVLKAQAPG